MKKPIPWEQVLSELTDGNSKNFSIFAHDVAKSLLGFCSAILDDPSEAEDVVQETLVKVYFKSHQYKKGASVKTWIFTIARNACTDRLRKYQPEALNEQDWEQLVESEINIDIDLSDIDHLLGKLNIQQKEVVYLRHHRSFEFEQIAHITGEKLSTVKMRYKRTVEKLSQLAGC